MKLLALAQLFRSAAPESLAEALVAAGFIARRASRNQPASELYALCEEQSKLSQSEILGGAAVRLGIGVVDALVPPTAELLRTSGFIDIEDLRKRAVLPQPPRQPGARFSLAVADPAELEVDEFLGRGIEVLLALPSDIDHQWQSSGLGSQHTNARNTNGSSRSPCILTVEQLALVAKKEGASELFLGHPHTNRYEFAAGGRRFRGSLHDRLVPALLRLVGEPYAEKMFQCEKAGEIRVAATTNGLQPIICVSWPIVQVAAPAEPASPEKPEALVVFDKKDVARDILLIEDDERFAALLTGILRVRLWNVVHARDVETANSLLEREAVRPGLVVCDLHLPGESGMGFLRSLRRTGKPCPVLILTSDEDQATEAELVLLGADAFVRKSADPRIFLAWCSRLTSRQPVEAAVGA